MVDYWDHSWQGGEKVALDIINQYDKVFFFQTIYPVSELRKIKAGLVWIPMYDGISLDKTFWMGLSTLPIKVVCFSRKLFDLVSSYGIDSICVQYFKDPNQFDRITDFTTKRVFFWLRGSVTLSVVKEILKGNIVDSMDFLMAPDPNYATLSLPNSFLKDFNVNVVEGFKNPSDYVSLVSRNNIFISPRTKEGMGMSFLESIAMGQCVIANDDSTMNEYISNAENGILFDISNPKPIKLDDFESLARTAHSRAIAGYERWKESISRIMDFLEDAPKASRTRNADYFVKYSTMFAVEKIKNALRKSFFYEKAKSFKMRKGK